VNFKFKFELTGEIDINEITDSDVFRDLRNSANWRENLNEPWVFEQAGWNREVLQLILEDEALLGKVLHGWVLDTVQAALENEAADPIIDGFEAAIAKLPREHPLREAQSNGTAIDYCDLLFSAFCPSHERPNIEVSQ
jgi:hypothetical protein